MCLLTLLLKETGCLATTTRIWTIMARLDRQSAALLQEYQNLQRWRQRMQPVYQMLQQAGQLPAIADGYRVIGPCCGTGDGPTRWLRIRMHSSFDAQGQLLPMMVQHYHHRFQDYPRELARGYLSSTIQILYSSTKYYDKADTRFSCPIRLVDGPAGSKYTSKDTRWIELFDSIKQQHAIYAREGT